MKSVRGDRMDFEARMKAQDESDSFCGEKQTLTELEIAELYRKLVAAHNLLEEVTDPASEGFCNISSLELLDGLLMWCNSRICILDDDECFEELINIADDVVGLAYSCKSRKGRDIRALKCLVDDKPKLEKHVKEVWNRMMTT